MVFDDDGTTVEYSLKYHDSVVTHERLQIGARTLLTRGEGGIGKIHAERVDDGKDIDFQTPPNELAAVARRDNIQHPYLERLNQWANAVRFYAFGTPLGRTTMTILIKEPPFPFNEKDADAVTPILRRGITEFPIAFKAAVIHDMADVGYPLDDIDTSTPKTVSVAITPPFAGELVSTYVKETGLTDLTEQHDISQGMFRALAIIIHLNYALMTHRASCIIIDDIGEGLDFERSCSLIDLLMRKAEQSSVQLIMATNDRFVMNKVPLEHWTILHRTPGRCQVFNHNNARRVFDEFKFTGLNNFDFFSTDFLHDTQAVPGAVSQ